MCFVAAELVLFELKNFVWRSETVLCQTKRGAKHSPFFEKDREIINEHLKLATLWIVCLVLHLATCGDDDEMLARCLSFHVLETPICWNLKYGLRLRHPPRGLSASLVPTCCFSDWTDIVCGSWQGMCDVSLKNDLFSERWALGPWRWRTGSSPPASSRRPSNGGVGHLGPVAVSHVVLSKQAPRSFELSPRYRVV